MKTTNNHIDNTLSADTIEKYYKDELSPEERNRVEKLMLNSAFDAEAMEGFEDFNGNISDDLTLLKGRIDAEITTKRKVMPVWYKIAGLVAILAIATVIVLNIKWIETDSQVAESVKVQPESPPTKDNFDKEKIESEENTSANTVPFDSLLSYNEPETELDQTDFKKRAAKNNQNMPKAYSGQPGAEQEALDEPIIQPEEKIESISIDDLEEESFSRSKEPAPALDKKISIEDQLAGKVAGVQITKEKKSEAPIRIRGMSSIPPKTLITGKITSAEDGTKLPGVNVIVKGSDLGTISDVDGNYSLAIPKNRNAVLVFSFIGYSPLEVPVEQEKVIDLQQKKDLDVQLDPDVTALSEVVVVGYGVADSSPNQVIPAQPASGKKDFQNYVKENIRYPEDSTQKGKVILSFDVQPNGSITNIKILKGLGNPFDQEAIRLVKEGPDWQPATRNGIPETDEVRLRIKFAPK